MFGGTMLNILIYTTIFILSAGTASAIPAAGAIIAKVAASAFIKQLIIGFIIGQVAKKLFAPKSAKQKDQGQMVNKQSNDSGLPIVYGRRRIGGVRAYVETSNNAGDPAGTEYLNMVIAVAEGECGDIQRVILNDTVTWDADDAGTTSTIDTVGKRLENLTGKFASETSIDYFPGTTTQPVSTLIQNSVGSTAWSNDHTLSGLAYLAVKLHYNRDVWEGGVPTVTVEIAGKRIQDVDNITPNDTTRTFDATGEDHSPVDVMYDYLVDPVYGKGLDHTAAGTYKAGLDIDLESFTDAKSYIGGRTTGVSAGSLVVGRRYEITTVGDTDWNTVAGTTGVTYAVGDRVAAEAAGSGTGVATLLEKYAINGVVDTEQSVYDNIQEVLDAFNGMLIYTAGKYRLKIRQNNETSIFSFSEDNIIGDIEINLPDVNNRFNHIVTTYSNRSIAQPGDSYTRYNDDKLITKNSTYLTEDRGRKLEVQTSNALVTDSSLIKLMNNQTLNQSRHMLGVAIEVAHTAIQVEAGDIVDITHSVPGWTNKLFRVLSITITDDNTLDMVLQEYTAGDNL